MYEYLYLPETSADGFANLTQYNKTKLLAKMAFQRYNSLKTCNVEFTHFKYTKQHTCESLTNLFTVTFTFTHSLLQDGGHVNVLAAVECSIYLYIDNKQLETIQKLYESNLTRLNISYFPGVHIIFSKP